MNRAWVETKLVPFVLLTTLLFAFWVVLSGMMDPVHLAIGLAAAAGVAAVTWPLLHLPWGTEHDYPDPAWHLPWGRLIAYVPWLAWRILLANIEVALIILRPSLPIQPHFVRFRKSLPTPVAHLTLANSITLTPGTVTVDVEGDRYVVHALTESAARSLVSDAGVEGDMPRRVEHIFKGHEYRLPAEAPGEGS